MNEWIELIRTAPLGEVVDKIYQAEDLDLRQLSVALYDSGLLNGKAQKKIHTIGLFYPRLSKGGVERVISLLVPLYAKMGYQSVVVYEEDDGQYDFPIACEYMKIKIPSLDDVKKSRSYEKRAKAWKELMERYEIDVMCYHASTYELLFYDMLLTKRLEKPFIIIEHDLFTQGMVALNGRTYLSEKLYRLADRLIALSSVENKFWRTLGVNSTYIFNPVMEHVAPQKRTAGKKVLWVGRLDDYQKQYLDALKIMEQVIKSVPDAKLEICGSAYTRGSREKLEQYIEEHNMQSYVEYKGYCMDYDEIYGNAAVHLVTSLFEAFPMSIYESKNMAIPLVTYDMPYLELLRSGKGQIIVEQGDIGKAAEAVVKLLCDEQYRESMGNAAKEGVSCFSNDELAKKWREVFENVQKPVEETIPIDEEYRIILETFLLHYGKGCSNLKRELASYREKNLRRTIRLIREAGKELIIYPYGVQGKRVYQMVKELYPEDDVLIADNKLAGSAENIMSLAEVADMDSERYKLLLCSNSGKLYEELRAQVYDCLPKDNVCDLYDDL